MKTANLVCVPAYDRPTDLADGEEICHGCGQVYAPDQETTDNFCFFCSPAPGIETVTDEDLGILRMDGDVQRTLTVVFDNESLAILRMAQV